MEGLMKSRTIFMTGLIGTIVAAVCCFTPLLVIVLTTLGLGVWIGMLDYVLLPTLGVFLVILLYGLYLPAKRRGTGAMTQLQSTLTCPDCGHVETETMPTDACQWFYDCKGCGTVLKPKKGDCCVYCSYGDVPCPPIQAGQSC